MKTVVFVETNFSGLDALVYCQAQGYRSILITDSPERFESWFPQSVLHKLDRASETIKVQNSNDFDEVKATIEQKVGPIDAILTFAEIRTRVVSRLAEAFHLKGTPPAAVELAQDKHRFRKHMLAHRVDTVGSEIVEKIEDLAQIQDRIHFPCFIKPLLGHSSIGAMTCRSRADVPAVIERLRAIDSEGISRAFIVEDFLDGQLVSVEVLTIGKGEHQILGIADRTVIGDSIEVGSAFPAPVENADAILRMAQGALDAIGYDFGPSHIELILTADGPHLVELNTRVGGSGHSVMLDAALGRSVVGDCVELCLGRHDRNPDLYKPQKGLAWHCYASAKPGTLTKLPRPEDLRAQPGVIEAWFHHEIGTTLGELESNFNWILQVLCIDDTSAKAKDKAMRAIDFAASQVIIEAGQP